MQEARHLRGDHAGHDRHAGQGRHRRAGLASGLVLRGVGQRPVLTVLVGAVAIAFSGILFRVSHVSASTGAFYRCAWALPPLLLLARWEDARLGPRPWRARRLAWFAGVFLAADLVLWHNTIEQVGAGLATVL